MLRGPKFGAASVSRTPFLSLTGRGFTGKAYAALQMGRHGNRVAAAEPGERSSLVGEVTRPVTTRDPPSRPSFGLRGKIEPRRPQGGFGVKRRSEVLHHPELCAAHSRHWLPGERSDLVGPKAFDVNEVTRPVTTRKGRREFAASSYLFVAALYDAPPSEPSRFALPSVSGFRLVPSDRPRASGRALSREPRDPGLPFRSKPEEFNDERPGRHKKTLRSSAREGPSERIFDLISDEIAPMSRAGARERPMAVQIFDCQVASGPHGATRIRRRGPSPNEAGL
jgi:hypothetical protein